MMKIGPAAIALLILGFHSGPGLAQSDDDDEAPPTEAPMTVAPKSEPDQLIHRHAGGDDNERPAGLLRGNPNEVTRLESTAGTGLAMDHSMLPGELGG